MEESYLCMMAHVFHGLQGVAEIRVSAHQYGDVVEIPKPVHQHINRQLDVDALLIVNQTPLVNQTPAMVIEYVRDTIQNRLRQNTVSAGNLAVTVS